jgi:hypothetical protein
MIDLSGMTAWFLDALVAAGLLTSGGWFSEVVGCCCVTDCWCGCVSGCVPGWVIELVGIIFGLIGN